jgi:hypothetical protein
MGRRVDSTLQRVKRLGEEGRVGGVCYTHSQVGNEWKRSGRIDGREDPRFY